jgi:hypothetical protein
VSTRRLPSLLVAAALTALALSSAAVMGCTSAATCEECSDTAGDQKDAGAAGSGGGSAGSGGKAGGPIKDAGILMDTGTADAPKCDADTTNSPENCGECGYVCNVPGAFPKCVDGVCAIDACADDFYDLDQDATNGCEYACSKSGDEVCDNKDNDCDGDIDEGFDKNTDIAHCGSCDVACGGINSEVTCTAGKCVYPKCKAGFSDLKDGTSGNCVYSCPVSPPTDETCNGVDDDCNGKVDDGDPGTGQPCEDLCPGGACKGECTAGTTLCTGTAAGLLCVGGTGAVPEVCDGKDNDCDGTVDNGFDLKTDPLHCGSCEAQCQPGISCVGGKCDFSCATGYVDLDLDPANGCEYHCPIFPTQPETCNGSDDDCNGQIDDALSDVGGACVGSCPLPAACVAGGDCSPYALAPKDGACYGACVKGVQGCVAGAQVCKHADYLDEELCNGVDDNCDGRVDEGFDLTNDPFNCGSCKTFCTAANASLVACVAGKCGAVTVCATGHADLDKDPANGCEYACPVSPPSVEVCNGKDDDCNGVVDDAVSDVGTVCTDNCPAADPCVAAGSCAPYAIAPKSGSCYGLCVDNGKTVCKAGVKVCDHGTLTATESCNGVDDNCDGRVDEGFNLLTDPQSCGACGNVCALPNAGTVGCANGLCTVTACASGYADVDKNPADGCEYKCPVMPTGAEVCDGKDNDCDGLVDDSVTDVGQPCDTSCAGFKNACVAAGTCKFPLSTCSGACCGTCTQGKTACTNGGKVCQPGAGPALEICDGKDNNCDGQIDEGFDLQTDPLNCGACGNKCAVAGAVAGCALGKCTVAVCLSGFADLDKTATNGCEYTCPVNPPTTESCNGKDDDCDGQVDESITQPPNFCIQVGPCSGAAPVCQGTKGFVCSYGAGVEVDANGQLLVSEQLCDGLDGNCNGQADESFPQKGLACAGGMGTCAQPGMFICSTDKKSTTCQAPANPTAAVDETCNGIDDDCDGIIDGTAATPNTCYNGGAHTCKKLVLPMVKVGITYMFQYEASHPDASASAVGINTVHACSRSGVLPWAPVTETDAAAACAATKDSKGAAMRLCTATEWSTACSVGATGDVWAYAANPTTYQPDTCNGDDHGLAKAWTTGSGVSCYANQSAGKIFDMSGNVAEWTSTTVVSGSKTYFKIRGGAFDSLGPGMECNFDFEIAPATFQHSTVGFRCCSTNPP